MQGRVYKIVNLVNGMVYVGQTTATLKARMRGHKGASKRKLDRPLYNAIREYGFENFKIMCLETIEADTQESLREQLLEREDYWAKVLKSTEAEHGYNHMVGGGYYTLVSDEYRQQAIESFDRSGAIATYHKEHIEELRAFGRGALESPKWKEYLESGKAKEHYVRGTEARLKGLRAKLNKPVIQYSKEGVELAKYSSITEASTITGVHVDTIRRLATTENPKPHKYIWKFAGF